MKKKKNILVVGLGAVGGIFACHLAKSGNNICGVDVREELVNSISENGLNIENFKCLQSNLVEVCSSLDNLKNRVFDYIVISVKTPHIENVGHQVQQLEGDFKVVAFQNGLDNEELLADIFGRDRVLRFVINYAGNIVSPGQISMSFFNKPNYVGDLSEQKAVEFAKEFAQLASDAGLDTEYTDDIKKHTWKKAILNAVLAPISALLKLTMAEVMTCAETRSMVELLFHEATAVSRHLGYDYGEDFFKKGMDYLSAAGHHKPSMLIDMENGFPTEIDFINGKIAEYGKRYNIPVPVNTAIYSLVKAKEKYRR